MKNMIPLFLLSLSGCAVGSGLAGASAVSTYSFNAKTAESLSTQAEDALVLKVLRELEKDKVSAPSSKL